MKLENRRCSIGSTLRLGLILVFFGILPVPRTSAAAVAAGSVIAWGTARQITDGSTNVVSVSSGRQSNYGLSLLTDGTVRVWGGSGGDQNAAPASLTNVVQVAAGWNY